MKNCFIHHNFSLFSEPLQHPFVPSVGSSVVLPCSSKKSQLAAEDITVHWRYNETLEVYDIIKGKVSLEKQDSAYYNRTEIFSEKYLDGNFSLKLNNVQRSDTGTYKCYITNELSTSKTREDFISAFTFCFHSAPYVSVERRNHLSTVLKQFMKIIHI
uniref:Ig-like domain-containing protein n=1 Tax=Cyprinus carpio TaxID=7962 RepID=A0A8C2EM03_CYPCA